MIEIAKNIWIDLFSKHSQNIRDVEESANTEVTDEGFPIAEFRVGNLVIASIRGQSDGYYLTRLVASNRIACGVEHSSGPVTGAVTEQELREYYQPAFKLVNEQFNVLVSSGVI